MRVCPPPLKTTTEAEHKAYLSKHKAVKRHGSLLLFNYKDFLYSYSFLYYLSLTFCFPVVLLLYISFEDKQDQVEPACQVFLDRLDSSLILHFIMKRLILFFIPKGLLHTSAVYPSLLFLSMRNEEWPIITGIVTFCNYSQ